MEATRNSKKPKPDCKFFLSDTLSCRKGLDCNFRHSVTALNNERNCRAWLAGICRNQNCSMRHPALKSTKHNRKECPSCLSTQCCCGYGNPSDISFIEQTVESHENDPLDWSYDVTYGCTFSRAVSIRSSRTTQLTLSSDGTSLVTCGPSPKALLWCMRTLAPSSSLNHSAPITDVCFGPGLAATSSADHTVKLWDVNQPANSLATLEHSTSVVSLDLHPTRPTLLYAMDSSSIFYWNTQSVAITETVPLVSSGARELRVQPVEGRLFAVAAENFVYIVDVEMGVIMGSLGSHKYQVIAVCWNRTGGQLASVSEDIVNVWDFNQNSIPTRSSFHLKSSPSNLFRVCTYHPVIPTVLVLGLEKSLELWPVGHEQLTTKISDEPVLSLDASTELLASLHKEYFKIWRAD